MQLPVYTIKVDALQAGILIGLIETSPEPAFKLAMEGVFSQLIALKRDAEKADGVTKRLLPDGQLEITDKDGTKIIRPPYSWEIGNN
jgi:hypothetical protein